jgi:DNA-binding NarL/FixJ family response regulator
VKAHRPDVALVDISMPGNGIEAVREVRGLPQAPRVIMLTVSEADDDIMRALDAGAVGYLLKGINATDLITAVKSVAAGSSFVSPTLAHRLLAGQRPSSHASALASLSDREKETLRLVARGKSNRQVARELKVQERTVKFHMSNIIRKLGVRNRVEAALIAQKELRDGVD